MEIRYRVEEGYDDPMDTATMVQEGLAAVGIDCDLLVTDYSEELDLYSEVALVIHPRKEDQMLPHEKETLDVG